jgi:hypothetical protein
MPNPPFIISGIVTESDGSTACSGAIVKVYNIKDALVYQATSAVDGSYTITLTVYSQADVLVVEAYKPVSNSEALYGLNHSAVDTGLPGVTCDVQLSKKVDAAVLAQPLRSAVQDREQRRFDPAFNADRVMHVGFVPIQTTLTRDGSGYVTQISEDDGVHVKVTLLTRDGSNNVTGLSERVA